MIYENRRSCTVEWCACFFRIVFPLVVEQGCFLEQWKNPEVHDADFIFFNNSSGWFNNSKALVRDIPTRCSTMCVCVGGRSGCFVAAGWRRIMVLPMKSVVEGNVIVSWLGKISPSGSGFEMCSIIMIVWESCFMNHCSVCEEDRETGRALFCCATRRNSLAMKLATPCLFHDALTNGRDVIQLEMFRTVVARAVFCFLLYFLFQNNPDEHSLEARLLHRLKNDTRNNGKILITLEHIAEWQPDCWERRTYKYSWWEEDFQGFPVRRAREGGGGVTCCFFIFRRRRYRGFLLINLLSCFRRSFLTVGMPCILYPASSRACRT